MKTTLRKQVLEKRPVNQDLISEEMPEIGLIAVDSPNDPKPDIKVKQGIITQIDGTKAEDFDFIDLYIV